MNATGLNISADTQRLIDRHTELSIAKAVDGNQSPKDYEDGRSYAVEALHAIYKDNHHIFDYWPRMKDALNKQKGVVLQCRDGEVVT